MTNLDRISIGFIVAFILLVICISGCSNLKDIEIDYGDRKISVISKTAHLREENYKLRDELERVEREQVKEEAKKKRYRMKKCDDFSVAIGDC